jgi:hypothetical protein
MHTLKSLDEYVLKYRFIQRPPIDHDKNRQPDK